MQPLPKYAIIFYKKNKIFPATVPNGEIRTFTNLKEANFEACEFEAEFDVETRVICIDSVHI